MHLKQLLPYQLIQAVKDNLPLLVPAGCIETHGPHMANGHDTLIVEEICSRIAEKIDVAIIATPHGTHVNLGKQALENNINRLKLFKSSSE